MEAAVKDGVDSGSGDPRFKAILDDIWALHSKKGADYGTKKDIFANIRASEEFGIAGYLGAILRANDKMTRLKTHAVTGVLANEGVEDSLMDLAAYAVIALVLFREQKGAAIAAKPARRCYRHKDGFGDSTDYLVVTESGNVIGVRRNGLSFPASIEIEKLMEYVASGIYVKIPDPAA